MSAVSEVPEELRDRTQWVVWRSETRDGRPTKVPYSAVTGRLASSTDSATWTTYEAAIAAVGDYDGVGFVFSGGDPYCGVDLDHCVNDHGEIHPAASEIAQILGGYVERSPSGRGLHVIVRATLSGGRHRTKQTPWGGDFETYDRSRFFTVTSIGSGQIRDAQTEIDTLYQKMFPAVQRPPASPSPRHIVHVDDQELLRRAFAATNGGKVQALYGGDTSGHAGDDSAADLALCGHLAFWAGPDPDRIDRLFRGAGLMRDKWDSRRGESTYGRQTIDRALQGHTEYYEWTGASATAASPIPTSLHRTSRWWFGRQACAAHLSGGHGPAGSRSGTSLSKPGSRD